jgi:hypothetical protein
MTCFGPVRRFPVPQKHRATAKRRAVGETVTNDDPFPEFLEDIFIASWSPIIKIENPSRQRISGRWESLGIVSAAAGRRVAAQALQSILTSSHRAA